jgi:tetratricopeptide (TPR) repeat protein
VFALRGTDQAMYYAQSWLLVHYLINGRPDHKFEVDNGVLLKLVESGSALARLEKAFDCPSRSSTARCATTLQNSGTCASLSPTGFHRLRSKPLPWHLTRLRRSWAPIRDGPSAEGSETGVGRSDRVEPGQLHRADRTRGLLKDAKQFDAAQIYYERAMALEPDNAYHELDYAEYFLSRASAGILSIDVENDLAEARRHFARSYALDKTIPETLAMNGASYLFERETMPKALESLEAARHAAVRDTDLDAAGARVRQRAIALQLSGCCAG